MGKFLEHELGVRDFTVVRHAYLRAFQPDIATALVFSRLVLSHEPTQCSHQIGRATLVLTGFDWAEECGISEAVAKRAVRKLASLGLITVIHRKHDGHLTTHITLNEDACTQFFGKAVQNG